MNDKNKELISQMKHLYQQQADIRDALDVERQLRREDLARRNARLDLPAVDRPRNGTRFTSTLNLPGPKIRQTIHVRVDTAREVRRLAAENGCSISEMFDLLAVVGAKELKNRLDAAMSQVKAVQGEDGIASELSPTEPPPAVQAAVATQAGPRTPGRYSTGPRRGR